MNIKKISGTLAVVITMLVFNSIAQADDICTRQIDIITTTSKNLGCYSTSDGSWMEPPIWQWGKGKKTGEDGCVIHHKLQQALYVPRDPYRDDGTTPPYKGKTNRNGFNLAQGAAQLLVSHDFEGAMNKMQQFHDTIKDNAKLNTDPKDWPDPLVPAKYADRLMTWALATKGRIEDCMPTP